MSEVALTPRRMPQAWFAFARSKKTKLVLLVPAATSFAVPATEIDAPAPIATSAQGCTVTVAEPVIEMLFGTWCVTPFPAQVSSALMLAEWLTTVPFGVPQATAGATVTLADPLLLESSPLTAVMVYAPAVPDVNVAVRPLGVRVPPAGKADQETPFEHPVAVTVAVRVEVAPGALVAVPILFAVGMSLMVMWASINTRVQTLVADDMLGRVMSLYAVAFFGGAPVGALLLGTLATLLGPIHAFALSGVGCLLCTLLFRRALPRLEARARARERALDPKRTAPGTLDLS